MCLYTNKIPKNVDELDKLSHDAYLQSAQRVKHWSNNYNLYDLELKKMGKLIIKSFFKKLKNLII